MKRKFVSLFCLFVFLLVGCSAPTIPVSPVKPGETAAWPTNGWQTSTPADQGMNPDLLREMLAEVQDKSLKLDSALVIRNGFIISETYFAGETEKSQHVQYSVTKSFTSTLLGIALDQGKLDGVDQKVSDLLPGRRYANPDSRKDAMTVENLLTMTSGLGWEEGDPAINAMYRSPDWVQWVMDLRMVAEPGERFNYCSGCSHVLAAMINKQVGTGLVEFGRKNLFEPLGISKFSWEKNPAGLEIGGWGLYLTTRDMAKLGYLYLHNGSWDGRQVVSPGWVKSATTKHVDNPSWRLDYGYQWWVARKNGAYVALGRDGQMIYVDPTLNVIVVFTARNESHDAELDLIEKYVLPAAR